jgi:hypothetical protein
MSLLNYIGGGITDYDNGSDKTGVLDTIDKEKALVAL